MRDRFGVVEHLEFYTPDELVRGCARYRSGGGTQKRGKFGHCATVARHPSNRESVARRIRDIAEVRAEGVVTVDVAEAALEQLDIDQAGWSGWTGVYY